MITCFNSKKEANRTWYILLYIFPWTRLEKAFIASKLFKSISFCYHCDLISDEIYCHLEQWSRFMLLGTLIYFTCHLLTLVQHKMCMTIVLGRWHRSLLTKFCYIFEFLWWTILRGHPFEDLNDLKAWYAISNGIERYVLVQRYTGTRTARYRTERATMLHCSSATVL